jgi:hypothetical protein
MRRSGENTPHDCDLKAPRAASLRRNLEFSIRATEEEQSRAILPRGSGE